MHITGRSDHGGGPEHILHLLRGTIGHVDAHVACPPDGVYWHRYADAIGEHRLVAIPHRRIYPDAIVRLARYVRQHRIDIIHSHGMSAGVYGRLVRALTRTRSIHTFHGIPRTSSIKHRLYGQVEGLLARWTDRAIAVSSGEQDLVLSRYPSYAGRLILVPNGIDTAGGPSESTLRRRSEQKKKTLRVVSFTRANRQKNPELLLAIADQLRTWGRLGDFEFHLYGEGIADRTFRSLVAGMDLSARVRCHPPTDDPAIALRQAGCYLSTSRWEGMPLSLIEAARDGAVVVASDVVGNCDLVDDDVDGLLFPEDDPVAAAAALLRLVDESNLLTRLAGNARLRCRNRHAREVMGQLVISAYGAALA